MKAVSRRAWLAAGCGLLGASARGESPPEDARIAFALNRGPYDASNAPFLLAERKGHFRAEGVAVDFSLSMNASHALQRVASEEFDFGFVDLSVLMQAALARPGLWPLAVFVVFDRSPACIVSWKRSGVASPRDLKGKTLAVVEGDGAYALFPAFLRGAGLAASDIMMKKVALADREQTMLRHEADGAVGFDSTIALALEKGGASLADLTTIYYAQGGLDLYSNSVIVSRKMLRSRAALIPKVLRAVSRGWRDALAAPAEVLQTLAEIAPGGDRRAEAERFDWIARRQILTPDVLRNGLGAASPDRLTTALRLIAPERPEVSAAEFYSAAWLPAPQDRRVKAG